MKGVEERCQRKPKAHDPESAFVNKEWKKQLYQSESNNIFKKRYPYTAACLLAIVTIESELLFQWKYRIVVTDNIVAVTCEKNPISLLDKSQQPSFDPTSLPGERKQVIKER